MPAFPCQHCGTVVQDSAEACPTCRSRTPFACVVCAQPLGSVGLSTPRSQKHPQGSYTADGQPLCPDHRLTRCYQCNELFPLESMTRLVVGKREDTVLRRGMRPRIEDVFGHFCPACLRVGYRPGESGAVPDSRHGHRSRRRRRLSTEIEGTIPEGVVTHTRPSPVLAVLITACLLIPLLVLLLARR